MLYDAGSRLNDSYYPYRVLSIIHHHMIPSIATARLSRILIKLIQLNKSMLTEKRRKLGMITRVRYAKVSVYNAICKSNRTRSVLLSLFCYLRENSPSIPEAVARNFLWATDTDILHFSAVHAPAHTWIQQSIISFTHRRAFIPFTFPAQCN